MTWQRRHLLWLKDLILILFGNTTYTFALSTYGKVNTPLFEVNIACPKAFSVYKILEDATTSS